MDSSSSKTPSRPCAKSSSRSAWSATSAASSSSSGGRKRRIVDAVRDADALVSAVESRHHEPSESEAVADTNAAKSFDLRHCSRLSSPSAASNASSISARSCSAISSTPDGARLPRFLRADEGFLVLGLFANAGGFSLADAFLLASLASANARVLSRSPSRLWWFVSSFSFPGRCLPVPSVRALHLAGLTTTWLAGSGADDVFFDATAFSSRSFRPASGVRIDGGGAKGRVSSILLRCSLSSKDDTAPVT